MIRQQSTGITGRHRLGRACLPFRAWLDQHTGRQFDGGPATDIMPAFGSLLGTIDERIAQLEALGGVHVTVDTHFMPEECGWCDLERPAITTVRVYGNPARGDVNRPLLVVEVCHHCAVAAIHQAKVESISDADIRVEVCE